MPVPFDVDCPEPLQNLLHRPGFALMNMGVKNSVNNTIRITFRDTKLVPLSQHHLHSDMVTKY
jgi:hypothetical protein